MLVWRHRAEGGPAAVPAQVRAAAIVPQQLGGVSAIGLLTFGPPAGLVVARDIVIGRAGDDAWSVGGKVVAQR